MKNFSSNEYLFWKETDIIYGNWYDGPNKDGSRDVHGEIKVSEVCIEATYCNIINSARFIFQRAWK